MPPPTARSWKVFDYGWPVKHFTFTSQNQPLDMAYLDVKPEKPNGRTVVLMHGKNFCAGTWDGTIRALSASGYRVIAPDQIGFCKSTKPEHYQYTFQQLADNTHALLKTLGVDRVTVIGHSTGGMLATRYALMWPQQVEQLVMVNPIGLEDWKARGVPHITVDQWYQRELKVNADGVRQNFRRITMKVLTMQLNSTSVMDIVAYGGAAIGMAVAVSEFLKGNISVAGTLCIVLLASEFFLPLRLLGSFFHIAMNGMAASDKIFKILDLPEPQAGEKTLPDGALDVTLKDVHFSYEEDREILKGIGLNLPAGSFVSLVGESGCGKSTIAGILAAKNRGYNGEIIIGGVPLNEVNETNLMQRVVLVRHNSYLFKGTVEENLKMAKPDATKEEMEAVLQKVNLLGFLQTQDGLQTQLLEKASNLSGGQCQRLVIARALLRTDSAVYIFDEAASNIDVESEELIMNVIHELAKTKTVLLISHRLANVVKSDKIYFLKDGEIKESGKHDELMSQNGAYRHLYESQMALENYGKGGMA